MQFHRGQPMNVFLLGFVVFSLGIRHGFDADHLAVIDGLTRFNSRANPKLARYCGALFSLGHGAVVLAISVLVGLFAWQLRLPAWLESFGDWVRKMRFSFGPLSTSIPSHPENENWPSSAVEHPIS